MLHLRFCPQVLGEGVGGRAVGGMLSGAVALLLDVDTRAR